MHTTVLVLFNPKHTLYVRVFKTKSRLILYNYSFAFICFLFAFKQEANKSKRIIVLLKLFLTMDVKNLELINLGQAS